MDLPRKAMFTLFGILFLLRTEAQLIDGPANVREQPNGKIIYH